MQVPAIPATPVFAGIDVSKSELVIATWLESLPAGSPAPTNVAITGRWPIIVALRDATHCDSIEVTLRADAEHTNRQPSRSIFWIKKHAERTHDLADHLVIHDVISLRRPRCNSGNGSSTCRHAGQNYRASLCACRREVWLRPAAQIHSRCHARTFAAQPQCEPGQ